MTSSPTSRQSPMLVARIERWPIAGAFTISRGVKTEAVTVVAELSRGGLTGRGECVPYPRYGETPEATLAAIEAMREPFAEGLDREALQARMPPGAARNALDCALLDLEARTAGRRAWNLLGCPAPGSCVTAYTISLGSPEAMAAATAKAAHRPLLKIKLGGDGDAARIAAVRAAAPDCELIVDANEAWTAENLELNLAACAAAGVTLVEQPLPAGKDQALGFQIMVGCMVATSLSMAPAMLLTPQARFVDLDGPLLLARDRADGLRYDGSLVYPPEAALWG